MKHKQLNHIVDRLSSDCYHQKDSESIIMVLYNLSLICQVEQELEEKFSEIHPDVKNVLEDTKNFITEQYSVERSMNKALVKILQQDLIEMGFQKGELFKDMSIFFK